MGGGVVPVGKAVYICMKADSLKKPAEARVEQLRFQPFLTKALPAVADSVLGLSCRMLTLAARRQHYSVFFPFYRCGD